MMRKALALALCLCLLPIFALSQSGPAVSEGRLTGYPGATGELLLPAEIGGQPLRAIGQAVFNLNPDITAVTLPEGVQLIEANAFYTCDKLAKIELPQSLQAIDDYAFFGSGALTELIIPPGVQVIGDQAFAFCRGLTSITFTGLPPRYLGDKAFDQVTASFTVPADQEAAYEALLGVDCQPGAAAVVVDYTAPRDQLTFEEEGALSGYTGPNLIIDLPAGITTLVSKPFTTKQLLRAVTLPEGLSEVGEGAFSFSGIRHVGLPTTLTAIQKDAFRGAALKAVDLPVALSALGEGAFAYNQLKSLSLPAALTAIPASAFEGNIFLADATLSPATAAIGAKAFSGCSGLEYLVLPVGDLPEIAADAFSGCPLSDVDIAPTATKAQAESARQALAAMGITSSVWRADPADMPRYPASNPFTLDEATGLITGYSGDLEALTMYWNVWKADGSATVPVRGLADGVFENATLKRFVVPRSNDFVSIGARAFKNSQLSQIDLFDSVTTIGAEAFSGTPLEQLVLPADVQLQGDIGVAPEKVLVRREASDDQLAALSAALDYPWYLDLRRLGEPDGFLSLPDTLTANAESDFEFDPASGTLKKYIGASPDVVVPAQIGGVDVRAIDFLAFSDVTLASVAAGTSGSTGLTSVILPHTVRCIGDSAFLGAKDLKRFECYGPVDLVGIRAFEECAALETVIFHNGVRELGGYAFHLCASLRDLQWGDKLAILGDGALQGCAALTRLELPATLERMGEGALLGCDGLTAVCLKGSGIPFAGTTYPFPRDAKELTIYLPETSSDEQLAAFKTALNSAMMASLDIVQRGPCPAP